MALSDSDIRRMRDIHSDDDVGIAMQELLFARAGLRAVVEICGAGQYSMDFRVHACKARALVALGREKKGGKRNAGK